MFLYAVGYRLFIVILMEGNMDVLGPKLTRAVENPINEAVWGWIMVRGCDEELKYFKPVINIDENYVITIKSGNVGIDLMIQKEIEEINKQLLENNGRINKNKVISAGRN